MDAILDMGEIQKQPISEAEEPSKRHQFFWVPILSSFLVSLSNLFIVLNNSATTYCIVDSVTSNSSRIMEISIIVMFTFCVVLLVVKKGIEVVLFFNLTAIGLQFSLLGFIIRMSIGELCNYSSQKWALLGIFITLLGAFINTGSLSHSYLKSRQKKPRKTIIWLFIGGFVYIVFVSVIVYLELHATYVFD
ncbi:MAG: hypothetical protein ACTSRD_15635 [Promethearchaeota archaeon]